MSRLSAAGVRCDARGVMALRDDEMRTATLDLAGRDDVAHAARQAAEMRQVVGDTARDRHHAVGGAVDQRHGAI